MEPIDLHRLSFHLLQRAINRADDDAVIAALRGRSERERRAVARQLVDLQRHQWGRQAGHGMAVSDASWDTACTAAFGCFSLSEIKRMRLEHHWGKMCTEATFEVLVDRRPPWVTAWAEWALDRQASPSARAGGLWNFVRCLIRAGVCEPLDTDGYILGMMFGSFGFRTRPRGRGDDVLGIPGDASSAPRAKQTLADALRADPGLLEREIWRVFEVPGRRGRQLRPEERRWLNAFTTLSAAGDIDRNRVQEATLDALARDISAYQTKWFVSLWQALGPEPAERRHNQERLLHLLGHRVATVVQFGLHELEELAAEGTLDGEAFSAEVEGVLLTMPIDTARHALRMLDQIAGSQPSARTPALVATAAGLLHTSATVRNASARVLAERAVAADSEVAAAVKANAGELSEQVAKKLRAVLP